MSSDKYQAVFIAGP
jgi:hypothetical protein